MANILTLRLEPLSLVWGAEYLAVTATQIRTPLEMTGVTNINDTSVVNIARRLQSHDKNCNPDNGITISGEALLATSGLSLDFESASF